jgi:hypothetical protein
MVLILLSFLSLMAAVFICSHFTGSGSDIVIILLTDDSCVYMFTFKDVVLILTAVINERNDNNMRITSGKREHIYTATISERNDNTMRTTSCKREHTGSCSDIVIIPLSDVSCV